MLLPPPLRKQTSCKNESRCCFRTFWNFTAVLARGGRVVLFNPMPDQQGTRTKHNIHKIKWTKAHRDKQRVEQHRQQTAGT